MDLKQVDGADNRPVSGERRSRIGGKGVKSSKNSFFIFDQKKKKENGYYPFRMIF